MRQTRIPLANSLLVNLTRDLNLIPLRPARSITVVQLKLTRRAEPEHSESGSGWQHPPVRRPRAVRGSVQERGGHPHAESLTPCVADHVREPGRPG
jgi:hypothetical protein